MDILYALTVIYRSTQIIVTIISIYYPAGTILNS